MAKYGKVILVLIFSFAFFISGLVLILKHKNGKQLSDSQSEEAKYYEFVYEDPDCAVNCLIEYIVSSNGIIFEKKEILEGKERKTEINLWLKEKNAVKELIARAGNLVGDLNTGGIDCGDCRLYHIFYKDAKGTKAVTFTFDDAPSFIKEIETMAKTAVSGAQAAEPFFVQFALQRQKENLVDYHIFPDGMVLEERFGEKNGELILADMFFLSKETIDDIKNSVTFDYFGTEDNLNGCLEKGFQWGYLGIKKGGSYKSIYTCGAGNNPADKIFNNLRQKIERR